MSKAGLAAFLALSVLFAAPAFAASKREQARALIAKKDYAPALQIYNSIAPTASDAGLLAEYAYALALMGFADPALAQLDHAFILDARNQDVLFFGSAILAALGQADAARELERPEPDWLPDSGLALGALSPARTPGDLRGEFAAVNLLMLQKRYVTASDRFARLTREHPNLPLAWAGYAIALEKIGAYHAAAAAVAKDRELSTQDNADARKLKAEHQAELEARPPLKSHTAKDSRRGNQDLKDRMYFYLGAGLNHSSGMTLDTISARAGRYLSDHLDASADASTVKGFTAGSNAGYNGSSFGASLRYSVPWGSSPVNITIASRLSYTPGPGDNFSALISPGISLFIGPGSIDVSYDIGLEGALKDTQTLSAGYTAYFGGKP